MVKDLGEVKLCKRYYVLVGVFQGQTSQEVIFSKWGGGGLNNLPQFGSLGLGLVNELIALFDFHGYTVLLQMKKEEMKNC